MVFAIFWLSLFGQEIQFGPSSTHAPEESDLKSEMKEREFFIS
jgi:hypothetical protein